MVSALVDALPRPVGFVLGGGGSLGAMQVGMLQALWDFEVVPDLLVGTSVGSLNGAVMALHGTSESPGDRLHDIWKRLTKQEAFPGGMVSKVRTLRHNKINLFPNTGLIAIINEHLGANTTFEDFKLPFGVVTTKVETAEPLLITSGEVLLPLLASCAIPGIYPPVEHETGGLLYDGGLVANVPMRQAISMGAKSLVVLDCAIPSHLLARPKTFAEVMMFTAMTSMRNQAILESPLVAAEFPVLYLPGPAPVRISPLDFSRTEEFATEAYEVTHEYLSTVKISGPGLYGGPGMHQ